MRYDKFILAVLLVFCGCCGGRGFRVLSRDLRVGETYDGTYGLCKWGRDNLIVWGRPGEEGPSPFGVSTARYRPGEIPVHTPDLVTIVAVEPGEYVTVTWTTKSEGSWMLGNGVGDD